MVLQTTAQAGTLESSDVMITVSPLPAGSGVEMELTSVVMKQYGEQIRSLMLEMLQEAHLTDVKLLVNDRGALECTLRARLTTALRRSCGEE